ncbi:serine hydrolase domain-containing protein [Phytomonospora sp. NPDC050363]|uniref:serine hydrolase domain-containing protein n=1 Tax=Phytomonospora sp. NPDC050363 TaxID=3155642 RepID=UPI0033E1E86E
MLDGLARISSGALDEHDGASVSVAVAHDGEVVFAEAWGAAEVETGRAATPGTAYLVASVTKPVTATAVSIAADAGLLSLDDPLEKHLGHSLPAHGFSAPTIRQTLRHRAGLGTHYDFAYDGAPVPALADTIARYGRLYREPGTAFEYSNLGYGLLDAVLRNTTGLDAAAYAERAVFGPLGMTTAHIGPSYVGESAALYSADGRRYPGCDTSHRGASLLWASAPDLARFGLGAPGLLTEASASAMFDALPINADQAYGLGWLVSAGEPRLIAHGGSMGGVATMLVTVPSLNLSVAVLTNRSGGGTRKAVLEHVLTELVPGFTPRLLPPGTEEKRPTPLPSGSWTGEVETYAGPLPITVTLAEGEAEVNVDGSAARTAALASGTWDLSVTVPVRLGAPGVGPWSPNLALGLDATPDGGLAGAALALPEGDKAGWHGDALSHHVRLSAG